MEKIRSAIGTIIPLERHSFVDTSTGRRIEQLTNAHGNSYPLYYFIPTISASGRYLIFHSERSGWVQLYRIDLFSGEIAQLTDGRTIDSGWALWCEWHLRGIYNHCSALNTVREEVYYFQADEIRATHIETLENRLLARLPYGRTPIGQNCVSPNGTLFAYIHADRERFTHALHQREAMEKMNLFDWGKQHEEFRNCCGGIALELVDTQSGASRTVISTDFHFHHVVFIDERTMLLNHPKNCTGMWTIDVAGTGMQHLRPHYAAGAHDAQVVHQLVTERGIFYEARDSSSNNYIGRYDTNGGTWEETSLPLAGYVHTGFDPAGKLLFVEYDGATHDLLSINHPRDPASLDVRLIHRLGPAGYDQRHHAHPFLGRDRRWLYYTDEGSNGFRQMFRIDVADLVDLNEYW